MKSDLRDAFGLYIQEIFSFVSPVSYLYINKWKRKEKGACECGKKSEKKEKKNPGLPDHWLTLYPLDQWDSIYKAIIVY